jgi:hypothetical protein
MEQRKWAGQNTTPQVCHSQSDEIHHTDVLGNTLVRLMYGNETTISLTKGDKYDTECPKVTCIARTLKQSKGDDRIGTLGLSLGAYLLGVPNASLLSSLLENGISFGEVSRILFGRY